MGKVSPPTSGNATRRPPSSGDSNKPPPAPSKARLLLFAACFWPLFVLAMFAASSPQLDENAQKLSLFDKKNAINQDLRFNFRKLLDRADVMGYGPTHPRIGVVVVGTDNQKILTTVESVFRNTDLNRIFQVCVVVDGRASDPELVKDLDRIDSGASPHWHGLRADVHSPEESDHDDKAAHGTRIHVLFNEETRGVAESRADAVEFIHLLSQHHERTGLKSPQEDLILLLLQSGVEFSGKEWLEPVTGALIVPPPLIESIGDGNNNSDPANSNSAMKMANAIAFNVEGQGKRTSFDSSLTPIISDATGSDINLSGGNSYPTPVWNGAALAMRLGTYRNLPAQDVDLKDMWAANLELSLNLWLCADGIDMIKGLDVTSSEPLPRTPLPPDMAARFAAAWMDDMTIHRFYYIYSKSFPELTHLEWDTLTSKARGSEYFPIDLKERCRAFSWYVDRINTDITEELRKAGIELKKDELLAKRKMEEMDKKRKDEEEKKRAEGEKEAAEAKAKAEAALEEAAAEVAEQGRKDEEALDLPDKPLPIPGAEGAEGKPEAAGDAKPAADAGGDADGGADQENVDAGQKNAPEAGKGVDNAKSDVALDAKSAEAAKPGVAAIGHNADSAKAEDSQGHRKPSKPLSATNLAIVQQATPIDISYLDVTGGHQEDPHRGAKDENGEWGYIHNATKLHLEPPPFGFHGKALTDACENKDANYKMLHDKVVLDMKAHQEADKSGKKRDKIFCLVYTIESGHPKIPAIRETWGPHCNGFMVGSTKTDQSLGAVEIPHEGPEEYNNIWQKVRSMWSYIYDNYYTDFDWFHIGGDDLFLIVENLRLYLESEEIKTAANGGIYLPNGDEKTQVPLFLGRRFAYQGDRNDIFISGGSGYTMNKAALKLLVTEGFPNYFSHQHTFSEDTMIARIFRKFKVFPYDTKDENGGERYMPFMPGHHLNYRLPKDPSKDWYAKYSIDIKEGLDHCAAQSVAFHYVKGDNMYRLYALMYHMCPGDPLLSSQ